MNGEEIVWKKQQEWRKEHNEKYREALCAGSFEGYNAFLSANPEPGDELREELRNEATRIQKLEKWREDIATGSVAVDSVRVAGIHCQGGAAGKARGSTEDGGIRDEERGADERAGMPKTPTGITKPSTKNGVVTDLSTVKKGSVVTDLNTGSKALSASDIIERLKSCAGEKRTYAGGRTETCKRI